MFGRFNPVNLLKKNQDRSTVVHMNLHLHLHPTHLCIIHTFRLLYAYRFTACVFICKEIPPMQNFPRISRLSGVVPSRLMIFPVVRRKNIIHPNMITTDLFVGNKSGTHIKIFIGTSDTYPKKRDVKLAPEELLKRGERFKQYFVPSRLGPWIGLEDGENPGSGFFPWISWGISNQSIGNIQSIDSQNKGQNTEFWKSMDF